MTPNVRRFESDTASTPVNAYIVEGPEAVVAVDATLTVSGGRGLRRRIESLGKPLAGVLVNHAHPDHYGGLAELDDTPVFATAGVRDSIRRDDPVKEEILRPMFGDEWPAERIFPSRVVADGERVELGGLGFRVVDLGAGESPHDSVWMLEGTRAVFSGDQAYAHRHAYLADGFWVQWLEHIERLEAELDPDSTLYPGHGEPGGLELLGWQRSYIETFVGAMRDADWSDSRAAGERVVAEMRRFLPTEELAFLMELSVEPLARRLGMVSAATR
jgi:glyoxylase-like metal-dependent hydrolase (beta-lactamase superfamily II)